MKAVDNATGGFGHMNLSNIITLVSTASTMAMMSAPQSSKAAAAQPTSEPVINIYPVTAADHFTVDFTAVTDRIAEIRIAYLNGRTIKILSAKGGTKMVLSAL